MSFQVCFHSFFKVLLIFPSRYFFAISFPIVFRLWCVLSPFQITLPSNSTLFLDKYQQILLSHTRLSLCIAGLSIPILRSIKFLDLPIHFGYTSRWMTQADLTEAKTTDAFTPSWFYQLGLCLVHSPLLKTSLLFSIPSLIDMLKLWEFSYSFQIQLSILRTLNILNFRNIQLFLISVEIQRYFSISFY